MHQNPRLSEVEKFNYLKSLLQGQPANSISDFSFTGENYKEAIRLLTDRYGNKQVLISAQMEGLLKLPAATSINETKKLRDICDQLESHVRSLQNIAINSETYGSFLSPVIMSKIREELRIAITRDLSTEEWDLESMLQIFRKELQIREKCQFIPGHVSTREPRANYLPKRHATFELPSTTSALFTDGIYQAQRSSWCTYCKGPHPSSNCTVMTNVAARKQFIRPRGKCFICLRSGHVARRCVNGKKTVISAVKKVIILPYASQWQYQTVAFNNGRPVARKVEKLQIYQPILQLRICSSVRKTVFSSKRPEQTSTNQMIMTLLSTQG